MPEAADNAWAALAKCYGRETKNKMLRPPQIKSCKQFETQTFVFNAIKSIVLNTLSLHSSGNMTSTVIHHTPHTCSQAGTTMLIYIVGGL